MSLDFNLRTGTKRLPERMIATGSAGDYWIEDTNKLRVQHGRHGAKSLFRKKTNGVLFRYVDSYPDFAAAARAAEKIDDAG